MVDKILLVGVCRSCLFGGGAVSSALAVINVSVITLSLLY